MLRVVFIAILLLLGGCKDTKKNKQAETAKVDDIDKTLYYLPPENKPKPKVTVPKAPPPPPVTDDDLMQDDIDAVLTLKAAEGLGDMKRRLYELKIKKYERLLAESEPKPDVTYHLEDKQYDYKALGLSYDEASLPVRRDRVITSDMVIPAMLGEGINSQNPGRVNVVVERAVLSPTLKYVLIPVLTKLQCKYEALQKTGQTRLLLACHQMIRPDGSRVKLSSSITASDMSGKEGLIGDVDNRAWQQYGGAALVAVITGVGSAIADKVRNATANQVTNHTVNNATKITTKLLEKNLDLRPVMRIEAGTRIILRPVVDIVFPKARIVENILNKRKGDDK